jgi:uncharacterized membrane protein
MYNRIAGQSVERISALSDGVFAIALTLIVLEIHVPEQAAIHNDAELWQALCALAPRILMYLMSFLTLGIFWVGQQTQLNHLRRADRDLAWLHIAFLAAVANLPFTTELLGEFITFPLALLVYWANILLLGLLLYAAWAFAVRADLVDAKGHAKAGDAIKRRIVVAQSLYAVGAALCLFGTYWSIGFIFLVQLYYAIAPRIFEGKSKSRKLR